MLCAFWELNYECSQLCSGKGEQFVSRMGPNAVKIGSPAAVSHVLWVAGRYS